MPLLSKLRIIVESNAMGCAVLLASFLLARKARVVIWIGILRYAGERCGRVALTGWRSCESALDSSRCPRRVEGIIFKEFMRDRDGRLIKKIPDGDDHSIDAVR